MNKFSTKDANKFKTNIFMLLFFVCMSNVAVFGQTDLENDNVQTMSTENNVTIDTTVEINTMKQEAVPNASNMNFVLWFMGSKQSPNATMVPAGTTAKKQFMTSGTSPNRLLIKAFLKKAVNFESGVV